MLEQGSRDRNREKLGKGDISQTSKNEVLIKVKRSSIQREKRVHTLENWAEVELKESLAFKAGLRRGIKKNVSS